MEERFYTINLTEAYDHTRTKRTRKTVKILRKELAKHMKVSEDEVKLSEKLNEFLWQRSMQRPPRYVKVKVQKGEKTVTARLPDEKIEEKKKPKDEKQAKEKSDAKAEPEKPAPQAKKEEAKKPGEGSKK